MNHLRALVAAFCLASSGSVTAQLMGARELTTAASSKGAPSTKPVADTYYLAGESGAKETYTLTVKGPASISIYSPGGHEMLTAAGNGVVKLEVVLPFTDVFVLAIARKDTKQSYTLARKSTTPTLAEAALASDVGFEAVYPSITGTSCWVAPGVKLRGFYPNATLDATLAADRNTVTFVLKGDKATLAGENTFYLEGNNFKTVTHLYNGQADTVRSEDADFSYDEAEIRRFTGYRCKDAQ